MKKEAVFEQIKHGLIVSCQALEHEPLYRPEGGVMPLMAKAAAMSGAVGIRANTVRDITQIKEVVDLPVIGIIKKDYPGVRPYITVTMAEVDALVECGVDILAFDGTNTVRPDGKYPAEFIREIKAKYPDQLLMADCSTVEEALHADELGFDFIGTTMVGYTEQSQGLRIEENDFEILREIVAKAKHRVIAEGNINTPEKAKRVIELGAFSVVVGSIITRPQLITKSFAEALD